jgi:IS5 family transposase
VREVLGINIITADKPGKQRTASEKQKLRNGFRRRAAIEPKISHLKTDHRLSRNFYNGITGDNINVMLAAAGMNFKRMLNKWKQNIHLFLFYFCKMMLQLKQSNNSQNSTRFYVKNEFLRND